MQIADFHALLAAFETYASAAKALGMSPQAFNDAKRRGNLPRHRYLTQRAILERLGYKPTESLWGFEEPKKQRKRA